MKKSLNIDRFNVHHIFNDSTGKTSGHLIVAFCGGMASIVTFVISVIYKYNDGITGSALFFGGAATLYGVRRFTLDKPITDSETDLNTPSNP